MRKILAFGASNHSKSINKAFAWHTATLIDDADVENVDLNDYELPMFGIDLETEKGIPDNAKKFTQLIADADGIIISFAEYNGNYTSVFKNLFDWVSRTDYDVWKEKPIFCLATSPGGRGAQTVLGIAVASFTRFSGNEVQQFSLPFFEKNFSEEEGVTDAELRQGFDLELKKFTDRL